MTTSSDSLRQDFLYSIALTSPRWRGNAQRSAVWTSIGWLSVWLVLAVFGSGLVLADEREVKSRGSVVADPPTVGGEAAGRVQVANLIYAGTKTSKCFSDHFLLKAEQEAAITTSRQLHVVRLGSEEIYNFPLLIMTGEGDFQLLAEERDKLRRFIERGGFLLASAGCSSKEWNSSFRREMALIFKEQRLEPLPQSHLVFHTAYDIDVLQAKKGTPQPLEGVHFGNRLGVLYSQDGLNDTSHAQGCCCCGGNEITNAEQINVNILLYTLLQ
jgi:hypothetical protein